MVLLTHFCLLSSPKCDLCEVKKAMFQVGARHCELIMCLLTSPKCDLGEVEKAMFHGLACDFELIFGPLTNTKCVLVEVEKEIFLSPGTLPLDQPKMRPF